MLCAAYQRVKRFHACSPWQQADVPPPNWRGQLRCAALVLRRHVVEELAHGCGPLAVLLPEEVIVAAAVELDPRLRLTRRIKEPPRLLVWHHLVRLCGKEEFWHADLWDLRQVVEL